MEKLRRQKYVICKPMKKTTRTAHGNWTHPLILVNMKKGINYQYIYSHKIIEIEKWEDFKEKRKGAKASLLYQVQVTEWFYLHNSIFNNQA